MLVYLSLSDFLMKIKVIGIDNDLEKLKKIKDGISYIENKKFKK